MQPLAFSNDGQTLALRDNKGQILLHETATGKELGKIQPPMAPIRVNVNTFAFAPDGSTAATAATDGLTYLWEVPTGKLKHKLGKAAEAKTAVYNYSRPTYTDDGKTLTAISLTREGAKYVGVAYVWDVESGKEQRQVKGPADGVLIGALSPDGQIVAWTCPDNCVRVQDLASGKELAKLGDGGGVRINTPAQFAPDGKTLFVRHGLENRLWDVQTGKELWKLQATGYASAAAFAPDGKTMALMYNPGRSGTVRLLDTATGKDLTEAGGGHHGMVQGVGLSADGKTASTRGQDGAIRQWDPVTGKETAKLTLPAVGLAYSAALSPDGRLTATVNPNAGMPKIDVWDVSESKLLRQVDLPQVGAANLAIAPDNKTLAARSNDRTTRLYDLATGKELLQLNEQPANPGNAIAYYYGGPGLLFSPDGAVLASTWLVSNNMTGQRHSVVTLWHVSTGKQLGRQQTPANFNLAALAFSPDSRTLAAVSLSNAGNPSDGNNIFLWETAGGKERGRFKGGALAINQAALAFTRDGRALAVGGTDNIIRLWSVRTGKELGQLPGHQGPVISLAFAADGQRLLSGSQDSTGLVWDVASLIQPEPVAPVALNDKQLEGLWNDLAGSDGIKAFQAIHTLSAAPKPTVDWLQERLKPADKIDEKRVTALINDLNDDRFAVRERATAELEKLGDLTEPALIKVKDSQPPSLELLRRVDRLLARLLPSRELSPDLLRAVRAVEVLELAGTAEARQLLEKLAKGAEGARLTREVQTALKRLPKP